MARVLVVANLDMFNNKKHCYFNNSSAYLVDTKFKAIQIIRYILITGLLPVSSFVLAADPSFDCAKAKSWSEIHVCNAADLAVLDQQTANLFNNVKAQKKGSANKALITDQKSWLRKREACKTNKEQQRCLVAVYENRIQQLTSPSTTGAGHQDGNNTINSRRLPSRTFNPKAVWNPPSELPFKIANEYCPTEWPSKNETKRISCIISKIVEHGASPEAVKFVAQSDGVEYLSEFREFGVVDLVALSMFSYNSPELEHLEYLVSNQSMLIDLIDQSAKVNIRKHPMYPKLAKRFPNAEIGTLFSFEEMQKLPNGDQRFTFNYTLLNGCRACDPAGSVKVAYDFDSHGQIKGYEIVELKIAKE